MQDRIFTTKNSGGEDVVLRFKRPTQTILSKAGLVFRTAFSRAFRQDIITNAEVEKLLRDRGLFDDGQKERVTELRKRIVELEEKLEDDSLSNEQGEEICSELDRVRSEVYLMNSVLQSITDNTCETIATEEQNQYICSECIVDNKTGLKVYKDVDEFKSRLDEQMGVDSFRETVIATLEVQIGRALPSNLSDEYAENKWRNERAKGLEKEVEEAKETEVKESKKKTKKS